MEGSGMLGAAGGGKFEYFGCECLITVSVLLQKISVTFKGPFWNKMWWYFCNAT
jgi:hypothetical protein